MLFANRLSSLHTINFQSCNGLSLYKCLKPRQNLHYINISLQTIDDLFILLNGLIPNVQTLIVQLCKPRLLSNIIPTFFRMKNLFMFSMSSS